MPQQLLTKSETTGKLLVRTCVRGATGLPYNPHEIPSRRYAQKQNGPPSPADRLRVQGMLVRVFTLLRHLPRVDHAGNQVDAVQA